MYHRSMNYSRESGTMLIPTRFVWPYGGRIVFISGSFTGWSHWPMTPVEGCPSVFQTICSLPPGYHQYKFVVDGELRYDEQQPSISCNIGTVNTILLNREVDYVPAMLSPQVPLSGPVSNMDVDNDPFHRMVQVQLSDGSLPESFPTVSNADIELSRHRIDLFLSTHQAYEMLPESGKVIALDVQLPVKQAFHILHEQGIPTAPLWNSSNGKFVGILSAVDFIIIMRELSSKGSNLTEEELDSHTISAWKEEKSYMSSQVTGRGGAISCQLGQAGPADSLKEVALKILQGSVSTVPIIYSPSRDGSNPQLLHVASLSGILKCICRFFKHSPNVLPVLKSPISAISMGTWVPKAGEPNQRQVAMLRPSVSLSTALNLLIQAQVSSIPIVDDHNSLVDVFSRSDITTLAKDKVYANVNLDEMSIHQALQIRDDPFSAFNSSSQRCFMCLRTDPLHKVLDRLSQPGVRRVVVVAAGSKRVEGIISLGDVFRFLISS